MHELIKKEIETIKNKTKETIERIKGINEKLLFDGGYIYSEGYGWISVWMPKSNGYNEFLENLRQAKKITKLKLDSYWIISERQVGISYIDERGYRICFLILGDGKDIIEKISNGKCSVIESTLLSVACDV